MGRHYSNNLRERVTAAVLSGRSCREVAALFSVSVASAVKWSQRLRQTGSAPPEPSGSLDYFVLLDGLPLSLWRGRGEPGP